MLRLATSGEGRPVFGVAADTAGVWRQPQLANHQTPAVLLVVVIIVSVIALKIQH